MAFRRDDTRWIIWNHLNSGWIIDYPTHQEVVSRNWGQHCPLAVCVHVYVCVGWGVTVAGNCRWLKWCYAKCLLAHIIKTKPHCQIAHFDRNSANRNHSAHWGLSVPIQHMTPDSAFLPWVTPSLLWSRNLWISVGTGSSLQMSTHHTTGRKLTKDADMALLRRKGVVFISVGLSLLRERLGVMMAWQAEGLHEALPCCFSVPRDVLTLIYWISA